MAMTNPPPPPASAMGLVTAPTGDSVRVPVAFIEELVGYRGSMVNGSHLSDRARELLAAEPQQAEPVVADFATTPSDTVSSGIDPLPTAPYPEPQQAGPTCEESLQVQPPASPAGGA